MKNKPDIDHTYRTMMIIWFVLLMSQFALFGMSYSFFREAAMGNIEHGFLSADPVIIVIAIVLAFTNLMLSFVISHRCQMQAIADQNVRLVQTGLVIGCALCESISIIGMVLLAAFAYPYFFYFFALGTAGIFLHFPSRKQLLDATFKTQNREP